MATAVESVTGLNRQNIMRLKVNRVALVQELKVEHIITALLNAGVIDPDDINEINSGTSPQDKTRILLDLLPKKNKSTEWYRHFRESLQNPEAGPETRRRYKLLVSFLDNTLIHRPTSQMSRFRDTVTCGLQQQIISSKLREQGSVSKLPHYSALPEISNKSSMGEKEQSMETQKGSKISKKQVAGSSTLHTADHNNMILVQGLFHQWLPIPENFRSFVDVPENHLQKLKNSKQSEDQLLITQENITMEKLRRAEVVAALAQLKYLPSGCELCLCDAVQDILNYPELYHLYLKHFVSLEEADVTLMKDICTSYKTVLQFLESSSWSETVNKVTQTGHKLASLLIAINKFLEAADVLTHTIQFLKKSPNLELWVPRYQAYIKLMHAWNAVCQPDKAEEAYFEAVQMQYQITLMSFGQPVVFDGVLHAETSHMMLQHGSVASALGWSKRALREVDPEDPASVVTVLCVAINSYCAQWLVRTAELLAIYVVQFARKHFGERHPHFIEALLHFCQFDSEFKQDQAGLQASKDLLDVAEKTYNCDSLHVAFAHRSISKALMSMQILNTDDYYKHAMEAVRISRAVLGHHSPLLHIFLHTFAIALQLKALNCTEDEFESTLIWAEAEAKQALALVTEVFGDISVKSAQMLLLLGQIYYKMNKLEVAEKCLNQAVNYLRLCQPSSSHYLLKGLADLGNFYKITQKPDLAVPRLQFVVDHAQPTGCYIKWIHVCFEDLTQLYSSRGQDKNAEAVQVKLSEWLKSNPMKSEDIDYSCLKEEPVPFKTLMAKADLWQAIVQKVMADPYIAKEIEEETEAHNETENNIDIQED